MIEFYLGGSRSGKSKLAEQAASKLALDVTYIATCNNSDTANDLEMQQRIKSHQDRRPTRWKLVEEPFELAKVITQESGNNDCLLIDCLTLWLSNCLFKPKDNVDHSSLVGIDREDDSANLDFFYQQKNELLHCLKHIQGNIIFVSNETNMGVVPMGKLSRVFCDEAGLLHQEIASISNRVVLAVAGLEHVLKDTRL